MFSGLGACAELISISFPLSKFVDALHIVRSGFPCGVNCPFLREVWHSLGVLVLCNWRDRTQ